MIIIGLILLTIVCLIHTFRNNPLIVIGLYGVGKFSKNEAIVTIALFTLFKVVCIAVAFALIAKLF